MASETGRATSVVRLAFDRSRPAQRSRDRARRGRMRQPARDPGQCRFAFIALRSFLALERPRRDGMSMNQWFAVLKAAETAARWHLHQKKKGATQEPFIAHLLEVASLVAEATEGS